MRNWLLGAYVLAIGCGDNSRSCGDGTKVVDGRCVPSLVCGAGTIADEETGDCVPDGTFVCTNGTRFDPVTGTCQIDPASCQNGTVLVGGACVDPTEGMVVDLEEGPEPNGRGVIEPSVAQAGNITVKPTGAFVAHGTLAPHDDMPDIDTYMIFTAQPVLLEVSADGVDGVAVGFAVDPDSSQGVGGWRRFGIDLGSDTSVRQIYLPKSGPYRIAVGDVRALFDYATTGVATNEGNAGSYYLSVKALPVPAPMPLSVPSTTTGTVGDAVEFYEATYAGDHPTFVETPSVFANAGVTLSTATGLWGIYEEGRTASPLNGGNLGTLLITVDNVLTVATGPVEFTLTIQ